MGLGGTRRQVPLQMTVQLLVRDATTRNPHPSQVEVVSRTALRACIAVAWTQHPTPTLAVVVGVALIQQQRHQLSAVELLASAAADTAI